MSWHHGRMVAFDVESTGVDPMSDRIVTACVAHIEAGQEPLVTTWLVDPGVDIPAEATAVHGVTTERARDEGDDPARVLPVIATDLVQAWRDGIPTVVMNAPFDPTMLDAELRRHGLAPIDLRRGDTPMLVVDPLCIDRALDRYRKGKKRLSDLCDVYGVTNDAAHDAAGDALAAARIAWVMAQRYPDELDVALDVLQDTQAEWHAEWAEHFEQYMRANVDPSCVIERDWPIRPIRGAW